MPSPSLKLGMHLATTLKIIFQSGKGLGEAVFRLKKSIFRTQIFPDFWGGTPPHGGTPWCCIDRGGYRPKDSMDCMVSMESMDSMEAMNPLESVKSMDSEKKSEFS